SKEKDTHISTYLSLHICTPYIYPFIILIKTFLLLGPSNSQKYTLCHVPKINFPSVKISVSLAPITDDFICPSEFPSICIYSFLFGTVLFRPYFKSVCTSGSAFSLIVIAAVVCGQYTIIIPSRKLLFSSASSK